MSKHKSFYGACERGDLTMIKAMLDAGQDVNLSNSSDGFTGLHYAVDSGNLEAVRALLFRHADPNKRGPDGASPLHWAARTEDRGDIIKCLLKHRADPNLQEKFGRAAIHIAANKGHVKNLRALMMKSETNSLNINLSDNVSDFAKGNTALHLAAAQGHEACVNSLLLDYKDNPDLWARNGKDRLPLHVACTRDNENIVKELIRRNALDKGSRDCMAAVDAFSRNPLQIACLNNNVNVVKYLTDGVKELLPMLDMEGFVNCITGEHGETALHCAARGGSKEVIDMLIKAGAKTDCVSASQRTPLHVACKRGNLDAATALANWNGDVIGSVDESGKTALMIASAENDSPAIAQMLIGLGAKILAHDHTGKTPVFEAVLHNRVNVLEYLMTQLTSDMIEQDIDKSQNTPLHWAADKGFLICCKILIEKKYKIGQRNKVKGKTPIHYAATEGRTETLKIMLESESKSCRFVDTNGNTPLHDAAQRGQSQCCRILLSNGASINNENGRGVTPLHLAAEAGHRTTVKVLLEAGAKFNVPDLNEETPLHYSARAGQEDTAKALINKGANLAKVSQFGDTPLLTAIRNNNENVIALLLQSEQWKEALTVPGTTKSTQEPALESGGDAVDTSGVKLNMLSEVGGKKARKEQLINSHPLHQLIIHYPSQARAVFDKCTYVDPDNMVSEEKEDYWVQFDYSVIDDATDGTLHPFNTMLQHDRIDLLDHPLISSVITYKWNALGKVWCYLNVFLNVIFVIFISTYALMEIPPHGSTDNRKKGILLVLSLCSIGLSGLRLVLELFQLITNTRGYLKDPMNYLEVVIFGLTIVFCLSIIQYPDTHPSYFQWEVGCYVVVFAWYNMLMSLKKLPFIGIYVIMIKILLESFIKVMLPIFLFLIPYILMFHMSFPQTGTFEGVGTTIVKVLTMFIGEINFDMYFVPLAFEGPNPVKYPYSTYPLYMMFLFLCPIILMNLLTGLAILDVAETRKTSKLRRSAERIEQIFLAEKIVGKLSFCDVFAVSHYPHGKLYPNKVVYSLSKLFGGTIYDFRGSCVVDIVSRRRQVDGDGELRLKKIQGQVIRIVTALNQLSAKIDVNTMQVDKNVNSEEIEIRKSRIIDTESGPA
ncbi:transient receptor potential cation channel subfamily A member 1 homolog [Bolinopsis microptera]|uniref:transient receptor potential cation channel subfamily A member 1 homolog n=1 Tax=Bolinopsis microptera TaxID=2820187 RepID=UPI003079B09C